jgi:hypothetical protein
MKTHLKTFTCCLMCLVGLASITWAQSSDQNIMVAQAPAQAPAQAARCINPKTGQPDSLVQCFVSPCLAFEPSSPFATCVDNYCGGCHAILCGVLLEDVSGGQLSNQ